jgi:hypothetical protein
LGLVLDEIAILKQEIKELKKILATKEACLKQFDLEDYIKEHYR